MINATVIFQKIRAYEGRHFLDKSVEDKKKCILQILQEGYSRDGMGFRVEMYVCNERVSQPPRVDDDWTRTRRVFGRIEPTFGESCPVVGSGGVYAPPSTLRKAAAREHSTLVA